MKTFAELGVSEEIRKAIEEMGYENPMPVQEEVIPYLLGTGNDVVALAQTGTGKTAAYGLPLIQKTDVDNKAPQSLILCPTRELCLQITGDITDYSKYVDGLRVQPVYGGSSIESQIRGIKKGVHIIVATPGRLIDLMERKVVNLGTISNVVMDEADEMLDMGFSESLNTILAQVPEERNVMMFSATMSPEISRISKNYLKSPKEITIGTKNEGAENVNHVYYMVHAKDKYAALKRIVDYFPQIYGIVFCRTRLETQEIADKLIQDGYNADSLHGELSQQQRDLVMQKFRQRHLQLLIATDVAARGLDVDDLTHVINYGFPDDVEVYTHRSGRTGRAGKKGLSIAIINMREKGKLKAIEKSIKKTFEVGVLPTGKQICEKQLLKLIDDVEKVKVNEDEIAEFLPTIYRKLEWLEKEDIIKRMVSLEFNHFLDYYSQAQEIEIPKEGRGERSERGSKDRDRSKRGGEKRSRSAEAGYARLFINVGKTDNFYAGQIIELLNRNIKGQKIEVGRIDLMQNFSFFEVPEEDAQKVLKGLSHAHVGDRRVIVEISNPNDSAKEEKGGRDRDRQHRSSKKYESGKRRDVSKRESSSKSDKPSREERGYTTARGPKGKDEWKKFFQNEEGEPGRKSKKK